MVNEYTDELLLNIKLNGETWLEKVVTGYVAFSPSFLLDHSASWLPNFELPFCRAPLPCHPPLEADDYGLNSTNCEPKWIFPPFSCGFEVLRLSNWKIKAITNISSIPNCHCSFCNTFLLPQSFLFPDCKLPVLQYS